MDPVVNWSKQGNETENESEERLNVLNENVNVMPNYNQKSTFLYSNESDVRLSKDQEKISKLESFIVKIEQINSDIKKYIDEKEKKKSLLDTKLDKVKQEFSQEKIKFKQTINFQNFFPVLNFFLVIISITIQRAAWTLIIRVQNYRLDQNFGIIQTHRNELENNKSDISFIYSQRQVGLELYKGGWLSIEEIKRIRDAEIGLADNFASMSDRDFEYFIAVLLKEMDYGNVIVTPQRKDFGTDITAEKDGKTVAVQCKKYNENNRVGNVDIQKLIGSMRYYRASHSIFVTTSYYTNHALEQTKNASIDLWDKDTLHGYVKKYLLKKNISEIFDAIQNAKFKEQYEKQSAKYKIELRKEQQRNKTICPLCGGGKRKDRNICSQCKEEEHRRKKRRRGGDDYGGGLPDMDWNEFDDNIHFNRR